MLIYPYSQKTRGNVLFIILIAIVLFSALTYAITSSERGGSDMGAERGTINATDYMSFGASVEKTIARILSDDVSESGLSFENTVWQTYAGTQIETANAKCTESKCKIFDPAGGGLEARTFNAQPIGTPTATDVKSGHGAVYALKVNGVGTTAHDLVLMIAVLDANTCKQINKTLKITNPSNNPPEDSWSGANLYDGTFTGPDDATDEIGDDASEIVGKTAGCIRRASGAYGSLDNYFYQVLIAR